MSKTVSLASLAVGIMLTIFGVNEMNSFTSDISRMFTGAPADGSIWMMSSREFRQNIDKRIGIKSL